MKKNAKNVKKLKNVSVRTKEDEEKSFKEKFDRIDNKIAALTIIVQHIEDVSG